MVTAMAWAAAGVWVQSLAWEMLPVIDAAKGREGGRERRKEKKRNERKTGISTTRKWVPPTRGRVTGSPAW